MTCHEFTLMFGKFSSKYELASTFDHDLEITDYAWLWKIVVCSFLQHELQLELLFMKSITTTTNIYFYFVQGSQVHDENKSRTKKIKILTSSSNVSL
jgi:hypothetical protein